MGKDSSKSVSSPTFFFQYSERISELEKELKDTREEVNMIIDYLLVLS